MPLDVVHEHELLHTYIDSDDSRSHRLMSLPGRAEEIARRMPGSEVGRLEAGLAADGAEGADR